MSEPRHELWLIRHGETEWSVAKRHTGRTDITLTPAGERQAAALGMALAGRRFALVLSSPLRRARETCRLAGYGDEATMTDDLLEWDYGIYEGKTTKEIRLEQPEWSIWTASVANGESIEQVGQPCPAGDPAVTGGRRRRRLVCPRPYPPYTCRLLAGSPPDAGRLFVLRTASLSVLGFEHDTRVITRWNILPEEKI